MHKIVDDDAYTADAYGESAADLEALRLLVERACPVKGARHGSGQVEAVLGIRGGKKMAEEERQFEVKVRGYTGSLTIKGHSIKTYSTGETVIINGNGDVVFVVPSKRLGHIVDKAAKEGA